MMMMMIPLYLAQACMPRPTLRTASCRHEPDVTLNTSVLIIIMMIMNMTIMMIMMMLIMMMSQKPSRNKNWHGFYQNQEHVLFVFFILLSYFGTIWDINIFQ